MGSLKPENESKEDLNDSGCVQDASVSENGYKGQATLLDLSDDVLLCILKLISPRDLKALGHTCPRLGALVCDRTLWTRVDARASPTGQGRLRWLLNHCLSPATLELQLTGYASKDSRCLGIQDLHLPIEAEGGFLDANQTGAGPGADVEHFLLRMWYPHLPRFAVSPRWPDEHERATKAPKKVREALQRRAEEALKAKAARANSGTTPATSGTTPNSSDATSTSAPKTDNVSSSSAPKPANVSSNSASVSPNLSSTSKKKDVSSGSIFNPNSSKPKKKAKNSLPREPEDDIIESCQGPQFSLSTQLMRDLRVTCTNLTSLSLEYFNIDYKTTNIRHFPVTLKRLSLRGTRCYNLPLNTSYLCKIQDRLPDLESLDVSECDWFEPASLMPLSKVPGLRELYMRDCKRLTECVAYASLATRYGFRQLRIMDIRGSPLADSEVSALGWLPLLEELYCAPPEDFKSSSEHTHQWIDTLAVFDELEPWELQAPEYYKTKSPEPSDHMEEDEDLKEEQDNSDPPERFNDVMLGNPWWAHERRIIVIQPNANRQAEGGPPPPMRLRAPVLPPLGLHLEPVPSKRPSNDNGLDLVKRPRLDNEPPQQVPEVDVQVNEPVPVAGPSRANHVPPQANLIPQQPNPVPPQPNIEPPLPNIVPQQPNPVPPQANPVPPQPNIIPPNLIPPQPNLPQPNNNPQEFRLNNMPPNNQQRPNRPPVNDGAGPSRNEQNNPRVQLRRNDPYPMMHIDVDIQRQAPIHIGSHIGYHLITDSAMLRFGRAENEDINYVHIGRNVNSGEPGMRPDRSNLRVLSVTGYRNITDRSLEHLATAAPYLRLVDFTHTGVTQLGVDIFKAINPDCEVLFSEFGKPL